MGIFSRIPRFGHRATHSPWFETMVRKSFDEVDVDKDGALDNKELFIALLKLYDMLNAKLPCHVRVPSLDEINKHMVTYDKDKSGKLQFPEYLSLSRALLGTRKSWRQSIPFKVTLAVLLKVVAFPLAGNLLRGGVLSVADTVGLRNKVTERLLPVGLAVFAVETVGKRLYDA